MSSDKATDVSASDQTASGKVFDKTANMSKRLSGVSNVYALSYTAEVMLKFLSAVSF